MTGIEHFLYGGNVAHGITGFCLMSEGIRLRLIPWEGDEVFVRGSAQATFVKSKIPGLWQIEGPDEEDLKFPWDIIGFDSYELPEGRWKFVLNCGGLEWSWESDWPSIEHVVV